jgi:hypothetical protein
VTNGGLFFGRNRSLRAAISVAIRGAGQISAARMGFAFLHDSEEKIFERGRWVPEALEFPAVAMDDRFQVTLQFVADANPIGSQFNALSVLEQLVH